MKLSISNIAWTEQQDAEALALLRDLGVGWIEVAPKRIWPDPLKAEETDVRAWADQFAEKGIGVSSFQALLFGRADLLLFGEPDKRAELDAYLRQIARLASWCGAGPMVFGSPKNRARGSLPWEDAVRVAVDFFKPLADFCASIGTQLVLEPNPEVYGCDFVRTVGEAAEMVARVGSPGFGLHLDTGELVLNSESVPACLERGSTVSGGFRHCHVSAPHLAPIAELESPHAEVASWLKENRYEGFVAIEMRSSEAGLDAVRRAVASVRQTYFADGN